MVSGDTLYPWSIAKASIKFHPVGAPEMLIGRAHSNLLGWPVRPKFYSIKMIRGLSHITIMVTNLDRTAKLFCEGLGAEEVYDSKSRNFSISREKYFLLGETWLVAMEGDRSGKSYRHIAFKVNEEDLAGMEKRLIYLGATIAEPRPRVRGEGKSLYFYDFDNNLFELHCGELSERLKTYRR